MRKFIEPSELMINPDGSIYHLHLRPENIADTILLAGNPDRVPEISKYFDRVEFTMHNREFVTHTGFYRNRRISVISSGIGTDNIDIVLNELDALVNIDLEKRTIKDSHSCLEIIRLGTTGALQAYIEPGSILATRTAIGFDGLLNFYEGRNTISDAGFEKAFLEFTNWNPLLAKPYFVNADQELYDRLKNNSIEGLTISAPGFYGPQGRVLRLPVANPELNHKIENFRYQGRMITNFEMECSAIYGLSALLGHKAVTFCTVIANRTSRKFLDDYKPAVEKMIVATLDKLS